MVQYYTGGTVDETGHTNSTVTPANGASITFTPDASSTYLIIAQCALNESSTSYGAKARIYNNTTSTSLSETIYYPKDATDYWPVVMIAYETFGASPVSQTYYLQYYSTSASGTCTCRNDVITAIKLPSTAQIDVQTARTTYNTNTNWQTRCTKTWTPAAGDYLIFAGAIMDGSSSSYDWKARITIDTTEYNPVNVETVNSANRYPYFSLYKYTFTNASHTVTLDYATESTSGTVGITSAYLIIIPTSTFYALYTATEDSDDSTSTSWTTSNSVDASSMKNSDHLVLCSFRFDSGSITNSAFNRLKKGSGDPSTYELVESKDTSNRSPGGYAWVDTTGTGDTFYLRFSAESGTSYCGYSKIWILQLETVDISIVSVAIATTSSCTGALSHDPYLILQRKTGVGGTYATIANISFASGEYLDTHEDLVDGNTYYYRAANRTDFITGDWSENDVHVNYSLGLPLAGTIDIISNVSSKMNIDIVLISNISLQSSCISKVDSQSKLVGSLDIQSVTSGSIKPIIGLFGTISSTSVTSDIQLYSDISFIPAVTTCISSAQAEIEVEIIITGLIGGAASLTASLPTIFSLPTTVSSQSTVLGYIKPYIGLIGSISSVSSVESILTQTRYITTTVDNTSTVTGILTSTFLTHGIVDITSTCDSRLDVQPILYATVDAISVIDSYLYIETQASLYGTSDTTSTVNGIAAVDWALNGTVDSTTSVDSKLDPQPKLISTVDSVSIVSATLVRTTVFSGEITSTSTVSAILNAQPSLVCSSSATSTVDAILKPYIGLISTIACISTVSAELETIEIFAATVDAQSTCTAGFSVELSITCTVDSISTVSGECYVIWLTGSYTSPDDHIVLSWVVY